MIVRTLLFAVLMLLGIASAQTFRIGAVLSQTGSAAGIGRAQAAALDVMETQLRFDRGLFGTPVEIIVADDGSTATGAVREATRLIAEEEVHALICCSTEAAGRAVVSVAEEGEVLLMGLSTTDGAAEEDGEPYWAFSVAPSEVTLIRSMVLDIAAKGEHRLGLMTLGNGYGDRAKDALELMLGPGGMDLVADERYPPGVRVLTPEALWVATRQPGGVIVWGLEHDSAVAYQALRERGYEGPVYLNPRMLGPLGGGPDLTRFDGALMPVSPLDVSPLSRDHPTFDETQRYRGFTARFRLGSAARYGAYAWDAMLLLRAAMALTLTYGLDLDNLQVVRQALRDSLVGMDPFTGAAAVYDFSEASHDGALPRSLVIARVDQWWLEQSD